MRDTGSAREHELAHPRFALCVCLYSVFGVLSSVFGLVSSVSIVFAFDGRSSVLCLRCCVFGLRSSVLCLRSCVFGVVCGVFRLRCSVVGPRS